MVAHNDSLNLIALYNEPMSNSQDTINQVCLELKSSSERRETTIFGGDLNANAYQKRGEEIFNKILEELKLVLLHKVMMGPIFISTAVATLT